MKGLNGDFSAQSVFSNQCDFGSKLEKGQSGIANSKASDNKATEVVAIEVEGISYTIK